MTRGTQGTRGRRPKGAPAAPRTSLPASSPADDADPTMLRDSHPDLDDSPAAPTAPVAGLERAPGGILTAAEIRATEDAHPEGLTAVQIVDAFVRRGLRFSEASFRKYVQVGLLPRSRRVGRKGKHKGSLGLYPAKTIRRINEVKRLMAEGYTIDEIGEQFLHFTDLIENLDEAVAELCGELDDAVTAPELDVATRRALARDVASARQLAAELVARLTQVTHRVAAPRTAQLRRSGAAGAAEDLL